MKNPLRLISLAISSLTVLISDKAFAYGEAAGNGQVLGAQTSNGVPSWALVSGIVVIIAIPAIAYAYFSFFKRS